MDAKTPFTAMLDMVALLNPACGDSLCRAPDPQICQCAYKLTLAMQELDQAGFVIVPKEPTEAMLAAGDKYIDRAESAMPVYEEMIAVGAIRP